MTKTGSYHLLLLVGVLSVSIFSSTVFVTLPSMVSNQQQSAFATFPGENGKIAFDSFRDGNGEIYVMNSDGSNQQRLTNNPGLDAIPKWSPDGSKIVFYREGDIYVMNSDGSNQQRLTSTGNENTPSWSPDGTRIVFAKHQEFNNLEIYVMNSDGSNQQRLTNNAAFDLYPSWSPDGSKIVFASERDTGKMQIYVMNSDGSNQQRLTNNAARDFSPDWSPDGSKIVFSTSRNGGCCEEIYVMNADGTGQTNLSNNPAQDLNPSWSPDGTKIAFYSQRGGDGLFHIYVMNAADGSGQTRLADGPGDSSNPDWGTAPNDEVEDTTPPVVLVPEDIVVNATTANGGTVVTYNVTAEDNVDGTATLEEDGTTITQDDIGGNITISCEPASGSEFPVGDTEVECTATDEAGNVGGPVSFTVTVLPPTPQPDPLTAEISSNATEGTAPATFEFEAIVTGGTEPYTYNWDFGDGSSSEENQQQTVVHTYDEAGVYTVNLTVTDSGEEQQQQQQQEATDTLEVTVNERLTSPPPTPTTPREAIERLISYIENLEDVPESAKTRLASVLERALALVTDNNARNDASACNLLGAAFINQVNVNDRLGTLTEDQAGDLRTQAQDIRDMLGC
jgi:Tol biopolymer transport system component/PKD repeat protein